MGIVVMPGVILLVVTVVTNYVLHKLGLETICQYTRKHVPKPVAAIGIAGIFAYLFPHVVNGYEKK